MSKNLNEKLNVVADIKGMIKLLSERGISILITDHNVRDTLEITHRAIIINAGQIMMQGTKQEILEGAQRLRYRDLVA